eukprot:CAMPEP_0118706894 /NCGR_PEP_ID=MMETSP0800-20121206/20858_1 /TAXON_ID=210618 ORGANISM="Striatella unipunctata, Strain CCMP2910" /NCGR_SAMPLE_ID=MMETSP0800 /ASSEMBLY_ACC=CAM_ASM_000638 /LENGTH=208 /DNA_ID=CAMNT_0006609573 /DNA_START=118 /DNA_END=744 /DNA_ORIENTATION=-
MKRKSFALPVQPLQPEEISKSVAAAEITTTTTTTTKTTETKTLTGHTKKPIHFRIAPKEKPIPRRRRSVNDLEHGSGIKPLSPPKQKKRPTLEKSVSFSQHVVIREHDLVVGDHPCCDSGLPLALGKQKEMKSMDFDQYELRRNLRRRRSLEDMRLSYCERKIRLKEVSGMSESDLIVAEHSRTLEKNREERDRENMRFKSMTSVQFH